MLSLKQRGHEAEGLWGALIRAGSGLGERDEEGAELDGLEAVRDLSVLPRAGDLDDPEPGLAAPAPPEVGLAEDPAVVGVAVHRLIV